MTIYLHVNSKMKAKILYHCVGQSHRSSFQPLQAKTFVKHTRQPQQRGSVQQCMNSADDDLRRCFASEKLCKASRHLTLLPIRGAGLGKSVLLPLGIGTSHTRSCSHRGCPVPMHSSYICLLGEAIEPCKYNQSPGEQAEIPEMPWTTY